MTWHRPVLRRTAMTSNLHHRPPGPSTNPALRQCEDDHRVGCALHGLEQRGQKRRQLIAGVPETADLAQIDRQLVEQDERRLSPEQHPYRLRAGSGLGLIAYAYTLIACLAAQRGGNLAPRSEREMPSFHPAAVCRVRILAIEGSNANGGPSATARGPRTPRFPAPCHGVRTAQGSAASIRVQTSGKSAFPDP